MPANRLILRSFQSPGDTVMLTAAVRDLHAACPGRFQTDVRTTADAIWEHNPHLTPLREGEPGVQTLDMHYPLVHQSNQRPYHFIHGFAQYLEQQLDLRIPVTQFRGDIHLSPDERQAPPPAAELGIPEHFWILVAGGKYDFTAKWWNPASFQAVVDHFRGKIQFVQCGESGHWHPPLDGVINLVGKTDTRQFIRLMHHADGVFCPVTFAMHLAAAVPTKPGRPTARPCVVIAGGREPAHWEAYPQHQFLSTNGTLPCCADGGCWKSRCQLVGDGDPKDQRDICTSPVQVSSDLRVAKCLDMISPAEVIERIERYYRGGVLHFTNGNGHAAALHQTKPASPEPVRAAGAPTFVDVPRGCCGKGSKGQRVRELTADAHVLFEFRHGLGDAVQFTAVLQQVRHFFPGWTIDVSSLRGKHSAFFGLCRNSFHDRDTRPAANSYQAVFNVEWHEGEQAHAGLPATKVSQFLLREFGIQPDPELYRYRIEVRPEARERARHYLESICGPRAPLDGRYPVLLLHYQGNTSQGEKDLTHDTARTICEAAQTAGLVPVVLDWDRRSPLPDQEAIFCPGTDHPLWGNTGTGDAEILAALIEQAAVLIGIDSGPLHVAAATTTPTFGVWTHHFPAQYFDLADNVTHLVPENWRDFGLARQPASAEFFLKHYRHRTYQSVENSLTEILLAIGTSMPGKDTETGLVRWGDFWIRRDNVAQDLVIVRDIFEQDAYRTKLLSDNAGPGEVVFDIGSHIGTFARLWHRKNPQARIVCVEACPENLAALRANVGDFATVVHAACTYEPGPMMLLNAVRPDCESTGGSVVIPRSELETTPLRQEGYKYWEDARELPTVTLEELMQTLGVDHIDVLKLDCEGSEYSILGKTPSLERIRMIVGEYHVKARWEAFRTQRLADWDYGHMHDGGESGGLFHYANPVWPPVAALQAEAALPTTAELDHTTPSAAVDPPECRPLINPPLLRIAVPAGIGDSVWALMKVPSLLRAYGAEKAHIALCGGQPHRARPFIERFDFVASVENSHWECIESDRYTSDGVYNWAPSGIGWHHEFDWMLVANRHLESGNRLETWLPEFETDWQIADRFWFTGREVRAARDFEKQHGAYCVFYLGPEAGNTAFGHNRGALWSPEQWGRLAELCRTMGLQVVVVGADYDRSYFEKHVCPQLGPCIDAVGHWPIGETFAVIQRSRFVIAYQSGIGIFSVYLGVPTACFWRPHGDSIDPEHLVSFREEMASAWAPPDAVSSGRYLPLIYTQCTPESIAAHAEQHHWHGH